MPPRQGRSQGNNHHDLILLPPSHLLGPNPTESKNLVRQPQEVIPPECIAGWRGVESAALSKCKHLTLSSPTNLSNFSSNITSLGNLTWTLSLEQVPLLIQTSLPSTYQSIPVLSSVCHVFLPAVPHLGAARVQGPFSVLPSLYSELLTLYLAQSRCLVKSASMKEWESKAKISPNLQTCFIYLLRSNWDLERRAITRENPTPCFSLYVGWSTMAHFYFQFVAEWCFCNIQ